MKPSVVFDAPIAGHGSMLVRRTVVNKPAPLEFMRLDAQQRDLVGERLR